MANIQKARVITTDLTIRTEPRRGVDTNTGQFLRYGQVIEVDLDQETTAEGFVWWKHSEGWSAARFEDNREIYLELATGPGVPRVPPTNQTGTAKFLVITGGLRVRDDARSSANVVGQLQRYQTVTVNTLSRTENEGYVWWEHEDGWSASGSIDNIQVFMEPYTERDLGEDGILEVPWVTQVDSRTAPGALDCGPACILMLLKFYGHASDSLTVEEVASFAKNRLTIRSELINRAKDYGLKTLRNLDFGANLNAFSNAIQTSLEEGRPVVVLVRYAELGFDNPTANGGGFGHWLVVNGFAGENFIVNDPLWMVWQRNGQGGSNITIQRQTLFAAYMAQAKAAFR